MGMTRASYIVVNWNDEAGAVVEWPELCARRDLHHMKVSFQG